MAAILSFVGIIFLATKAPAAPKREVVEYANFSCKVVSSKNNCLDQLNLMGADGWQLGAATFNTIDDATFWLQRKKQ